MGGGAISRIRFIDVVPLATHTRLPERSAGLVIGESRGARMRCAASRYTVEKLTTLRRSQVMVIVLTTTSTSPFCSAVIRSADDRIRYSTCDGLPKMSRATSPAMSTSKPTISPVIGSRKLNRLLPMSKPDDQPAACADIGHCGVGVGRVVERPQAGGGVAVVGGLVRGQRRLRRHLLHPGRRGRRQRRRGRDHHRPRLAAARQHRRRRHGDAQHPERPPHHRYSINRGHSPSATATAAPRLSTMPPTVAPDRPARALRMSSRSS